MSQTALTELTVSEIRTIYNPDDKLWTAWTIGNSRVWGTGKSEQGAINDMWIYQGLLVDAGAQRIAEGRQVWQEVLPK